MQPVRLFVDGRSWHPLPAAVGRFAYCTPHHSRAIEQDRDLSATRSGAEANITSMTLENVSAHIRRRSLSPMSQARQQRRKSRQANGAVLSMASPSGSKTNIDVAGMPTSEALSMLRDRIRSA